MDLLMERSSESWTELGLLLGLAGGELGGVLECSLHGKLVGASDGALEGSLDGEVDGSLDGEARVFAWCSSGARAWQSRRSTRWHRTGCDKQMAKISGTY